MARYLLFLAILCIVTSCEKESPEQDESNENIIKVWEFADFKDPITHLKASYCSFSETQEKAITEFKELFEYDYGKDAKQILFDTRQPTEKKYLCARTNAKLTSKDGKITIKHGKTKINMTGSSLQDNLDFCNNYYIKEERPLGSVTGTLTPLGILAYSNSGTGDISCCWKVNIRLDNYNDLGKHQYTDYRNDTLCGMTEEDMDKFSSAILKLSTNTNKYEVTYSRIQ